MPNKFKINEIFLSIQGESTTAGLPFIFIRFTGCSLRCSWCDSSYAFEEGEYYSINEIIAIIDQFYPQNVLLTGGEPLEQPYLLSLIDALLQKGKILYVETSGAHSIKEIPHSVSCIVDVKTPSSGESKSFNYNILQEIRPKDELKFVISNYDDFLYSLDFIRKNELEKRDSSLIMSTVFNTLDSKQLVEWVLKEKLNVRVQLQLHKYIWDPLARGV